MIRSSKRLLESCFIYVLLTLLGGAVTVYGQPAKPSPAAPAALSREGAREPFFLSAESARAENGDIRWEAFDNRIRTVLQAEVTARKARTAATGAADSPCSVRTISFDHSPGASEKFDDVAASAHAVHRGRVISATPGFEFTTPVTLLGIEIDRAVRSDKGFPDTGTVYVIYPQADFSIGGVRFCNAGPIQGFAPAVGDQLLLMGFNTPIPAANYRFALTRPEHLVFSQRDRVYSPFAELTSASEPTSLKGIEKRVIAITAAQKKDR